MPISIIKTETTPNPNARKFIVEPAPRSIRSFFKPEDALDDPIGHELFQIPGITNVLIHTGFISVCVEPGTNWKKTIKTIEETLALIDSDSAS